MRIASVFGCAFVALLCVGPPTHAQAFRGAPTVVLRFVGNTNIDLYWIGDTNVLPPNSTVLNRTGTTPRSVPAGTAFFRDDVGIVKGQQYTYSVCYVYESPQEQYCAGFTATAGQVAGLLVQSLTWNPGESYTLYGPVQIGPAAVLVINGSAVHPYAGQTGGYLDSYRGRLQIDHNAELSDVSVRFHSSMPQSGNFLRNSQFLRDTARVDVQILGPQQSPGSLPNVDVTNNTFIGNNNEDFPILSVTGWVAANLMGNTFTTDDERTNNPSHSATVGTPANVDPYGVPQLTIDGNHFDRATLALTGVMDASITNNQFAGQHETAAGTAIDLYLAAAQQGVGVKVGGNRVSSYGTAILVNGPDGTAGTSSVTEISHNTLRKNGYALLIEKGLGPAADNCIAGNGVGLQAPDGLPVNAQSNWWGDSSGPSAPSNPGGRGDVVKGNQVIVTPYLKTDICGQDPSGTPTPTPTPTPPPTSPPTSPPSPTRTASPTLNATETSTQTPAPTPATTISPAVSPTWMVPPTATPSMTPTPSRTLTGTSTPTPNVTATATPQLCEGACTVAGAVTVHDLLKLINLHGGQPDSCPTGHPHGLPVTSADLIVAVDNLLAGCPTE